MQNTPSALRALATLPRSLRFWLAYHSGYLALRLGRKVGLVSDALLRVAGIPILINWVLTIARWAITGSPTPRPDPRN